MFKIQRTWSNYATSATIISLFTGTITQQSDPMDFENLSGDVFFTGVKYEDYFCWSSKATADGRDVESLTVRNIAIEQKKPVRTILF